MNRLPKIVLGLEKWHPLTELPQDRQPDKDQHSDKPEHNDKSPSNQVEHPLLSNVTADEKRVLYDAVFNPYCSVSLKIKRLGISAYRFEKAKHGLCEKSLVFESFAGQTLYLIPHPKTFAAFSMECPYPDTDKVEHSFYSCCCTNLLRHDPNIKKVHIAMNFGQANAVADVVSVGHNGIRKAWEITLSTTNLLSNAMKYKETDFVQIIFLCRNWKLREAVKAYFRESGLETNMFERLDYMHFSQFLNRQRKFYRY